MKPISWNDIEMYSDLAVRIGLNSARLEAKGYRPSEVFTADAHGWPGDYEGRVMLALVLYKRVTGRTPAYLEEMVDLIPSHLNKKGYFGPVLPEGVNDEQQMAGHSWYLRSLLEYYAWKPQERIKQFITNVVENLLLPSKGNYARYPIDLDTRWESEHWHLSKLQSKGKAHAESSDCGCAFIMLDGATAVYEMMPRDDLKELIFEMIDRFRHLDFKTLKVQTHATLSALRGILRMHELTGNASLLELVDRVFAFYKTEAWTGIYGNYNWFTIPRWTEPCAIIDSYILSVRLWNVTGRSAYLHDAHHIYYNAIAHAQRETGAFGTDTCVGSQDGMLRPLTYEVTWCCTMRGAEGLSRAVENAFFVDKMQNHVSLPFYYNCKAVLRFDAGDLTVREKTSYPIEGQCTLEILESTVSSPVTIRFFIPDWTAGAPVLCINGNVADYCLENGFASVEGLFKAGDKLTCIFEQELCIRENTFNSNNDRDYFTFRHGPLILARATENEIAFSRDLPLEHKGNGSYSSADAHVLLSPLSDIGRLTSPTSSLQPLFKTV
jgi:uncharacterized protein